MLHGYQFDVTYPTHMIIESLTRLIDNVTQMLPLTPRSRPIVESEDLRMLTSLWRSRAAWWTHTSDKSDVASVSSMSSLLWISRAHALVGSDPQRALCTLNEKYASSEDSARAFVLAAQCNAYMLMTANMHHRVYDMPANAFSDMEFDFAVVTVCCTSPVLSMEEAKQRKDPYLDVMYPNPSDDTIAIKQTGDRYADIRRLVDKHDWNAYPIECSETSEALLRMPNTVAYDAPRFAEMCNRGCLLMHTVIQMVTETRRGVPIADEHTKQCFRVLVDKTKAMTSDTSNSMFGVTKELLFNLISAASTREYFQRFDSSCLGFDVDDARKKYKPTGGYNTLPTAVQTDLGSNAGTDALLLATLTPARVMGISTFVEQMHTDEGKAKAFEDSVAAMLDPANSDPIRDILMTTTRIALWDAHFTDSQSQSSTAVREHKPDVFRHKYIVTEYDLCKKMPFIRSAMDKNSPRLPLVINMLGKWYVNSVRRDFVEGMNWGDDVQRSFGDELFVLVPCESFTAAIAEWCCRVHTIHKGVDVNLVDVSRCYASIICD